MFLKLNRFHFISPPAQKLILYNVASKIKFSNNKGERYEYILERKERETETERDIKHK